MSCFFGSLVYYTAFYHFLKCAAVTPRIFTLDVYYVQILVLFPCLCFCIFKLNNNPCKLAPYTALLGSKACLVLRLHSKHSSGLTSWQLKCVLSLIARWCCFLCIIQIQHDSEQSELECTELPVLSDISRLEKTNKTSGDHLASVHQLVFKHIHTYRHTHTCICVLSNSLFNAGWNALLETKLFIQSLHGTSLELCLMTHESGCNRWGISGGVLRLAGVVPRRRADEITTQPFHYHVSKFYSLKNKELKFA